MKHKLELPSALRYWQTENGFLPVRVEELRTEMSQELFQLERACATNATACDG